MVYAAALTLLFLRTYTATHRRQSRRGAQYACGLGEIAALYVFDKAGYVDADRTSLHACGLGAVHASGGLKHGLFGRQTPVDFIVTGHAVSRVKLIHFHSGYSRALSGAHGCPQVGAPLCVTRRYAVVSLFHRLPFGNAIRAQAHHHFVKIHLVGVKLGAVDTYKACAAADGHAAGTAHAGAVNHNGI